MRNYIFNPIAAYQRMLSRQPLITQMVSAGTIGCTGDALCQLYVLKFRPQHKPYFFFFSYWSQKTDIFNYYRSARFFIVPCFFIAPTVNIWYRVLNLVKGHKYILPLKKTLIDQVCFAPFLNAAILFNFRLLEGNSPRDAWLKIRTVYWEIYKQGLMYWPLVQLLNFYTIPSNFRIVFLQLAALGWNSFLSYKMHQ